MFQFQFQIFKMLNIYTSFILYNDASVPVWEQKGTCRHGVHNDMA